MGNGMNKVLPGLYLGNIRGETTGILIDNAELYDSKDMAQLAENKITHVVAIHDNAQALLEHLDYKCIQVADNPAENLIPYFRECIDYIHRCRIKEGACLVHCIAGISRSTTIVAAYIMTVTTLNWKEALKAIKCARSVANPNYGFQRQLQDFDNKHVQKEREILNIRHPDVKFNDEEILREYLAKSDASTDVDDEIPITLSKYHDNRTARISAEEADEFSSTSVKSE